MDVSIYIWSMTCSEFFNFVSKYSKLIKQIHSSQKYKKIQVEEAGTLDK